MDDKLLKINEELSIHVPGDLTPAQEAQIIARLRAQLDDETLEAECRELLRLEAAGELLSVAQARAEMEKRSPGAGGGEHGR